MRVSKNIFKIKIKNKNKSAYIICPSNLKELIQKELPSAIFSCIDLEEFIDKERNIYD